MLFALGALPLEERAVYLAHLEACELCWQLADQAQTVAGLLQETVEEQPVSPDLKERIMGHARSEADAGLRRREELGRLAHDWPRTSWLSPAWAAIALALVFALVGVVVWNVILSDRLATRDDALAEQSLILDAISAGGQVFRLSGTPDAPSASGVLVQDPGTGRAVLVVNGLPALASEKEYQVWRIHDGTPDGVGTFSVADVEELVVLSAEFSSSDQVGVSVEPRGGSPAPTGVIVLLGAASS